MGISTVAIYSEADRDSKHVQMADEAFCVGPAPSAESYLQAAKIIQICKDNNVDGIHPGYGFLSENADFVKAVKNAGITFIGPSPEAIDLMGSKIASKQAVEKYGVPLVPGINHAVEDITEAADVANQIGYPVLVKASAGGGGKGMRIVHDPKDLESQMRTAQSEAKSAFGDRSVFIEKFVTKPRHIEIQLIADNHGNVIYLLERECSIQRRHQKLVEEAPSVVLTPALRKAMGEAAVNVAKACNYSGAGTVEFLLDADHHFYFLEMNTRLQVEHCVTEMITGIDLVKAQIEVARGEVLSFKQEDLVINGHAIELRVCAEDPYNNFLPDTGKLELYTVPKGPGVRVDDGYEQGQAIPIYYDPMIAKLIVHAPTRNEAIQKMSRAIDEYHIKGIQTTLPFGKWAIHTDAFSKGNFDTKFIDTYFKSELLQSDDAATQEVAAQVALYIWEQEKLKNKKLPLQGTGNKKKFPKN